MVDCRGNGALNPQSLEKLSYVALIVIRCCNDKLARPEKPKNASVTPLFAKQDKGNWIEMQVRVLSEAPDTRNVMDYFDKCWNFNYLDDVDGSFEILQCESPKYGDTVLSFGPCKITLNELFDLGYMIYVDGRKTQKRIKILLTNGRDRYVLYKTTFDVLSKTPDLGIYAKLTKNTLLKRRNNDLHLTSEYMLDRLKDMYPTVKKDFLIDNQSIEEYVRQQLKMRV